MSASVSDSPNWYLVRTLPRQEDRAEGNLRAWGVETFLPRLREVRLNKYTGHSSFTVNPLFPRYLFARFAVNGMYHKVSFTRGVQSVVSFGGDPTRVDDEIISIIRSRVEDDGFVRIGEDLKEGDEVTIEAGPFRNLKGIFERSIENTDRVVILLKTLSYQAHVEIGADLIKKVS